jgi:type IV secretion system protein VirB1
VIDLALIQQCAPTVAPATIQAIIRAESGFNPLALHVNGNVRLRYPPSTVAEAVTWSDWLIKRGYSVDMGLMQINSRNLASLNLTPEGTFDPCQNIRAGAALLTAHYGRAAQNVGAGTGALLQAISAYNTGNFHGGFSNGYVARVVMGSSAASSAPVIDVTCLLGHCSSNAVNSAEPIRPTTAETAIRGFVAKNLVRK